jgi:hypothetical protein
MSRGITTSHVGSYERASQQDIIDGDSFEGPIIVLSGTADAINPHVAGNYIVNTGSADAMTLAAPTAGVDDGLSINVYSDSTQAHTITATSLFANGTALKTTATFAAFRGAGVNLRAYNGVWQVIGQTAITFT